MNPQNQTPPTHFLHKAPPPKGSTTFLNSVINWGLSVQTHEREWEHFTFKPQ